MAVGHAVFTCILILFFFFFNLLGTYEHNTNMRMWSSHLGQNPARTAERFHTRTIHAMFCRCSVHMVGAILDFIKRGRGNSFAAG